MNKYKELKERQEEELDKLRICKNDRPDFSVILNRHKREMKAAIDADTTGEGFISDMFDYELSNHEYCYTGDLTNTLQALGLTKDDINASAKLKHGLQKAIKKQSSYL